jgi:hypothetical protein
MKPLRAHRRGNPAGWNGTVASGCLDPDLKE